MSKRNNKQYKKVISHSSPWLTHQPWRDNTIYSDARSNIHFYWSAAFVLLIFGFLPLESTDTHVSNEIRLISIFPFNLLTFLSFTAAIRATWQWWRFRASPLHLDPFPGAIGGDVGGEIAFNIPYRKNIRAEVQLSVLRNEINSRGNHSSSVLWQDDGYARVNAQGEGLSLQFRFTVPDDLPQSDVPGKTDNDRDDSITWKLHVVVNLPGEKIEREYEIPVYPEADDKKGFLDNLGEAHNETTEHAMEFLGKIDEERPPLGGRNIKTTIDTTRENPFANSMHAAHKLLPLKDDGRIVTIKYPLRPFPLIAQVFLLFAFTFSSLGMLLIFSPKSHGMQPYLFGGIFLLIGISFGGKIIYRQLTSLRVSLNGRIIISERMFLGIAVYSRLASYYDIKEIRHKLSSGGKEGASYMAERTVYAIIGNGTITLAERVEGRGKAKIICNYFKDKTRSVSMVAE